MLPEAVDMLDFIIFEIQPEFLRVFECSFDVGSVECPMVDGTSGQRSRITLPRFDGQMAVTQECTTVFAVMEQSGQFETKLLRIEFDGFVEILRRMPECCRSVVNSDIAFAIKLPPDNDEYD